MGMTFKAGPVDFSGIAADVIPVMLIGPLDFGLNFGGAPGLFKSQIGADRLPDLFQQ